MADLETRKVINDIKAFIEKWKLDASASYDLCRLLMQIKDFPSYDHADYDLVEWLEQQT